MTLSRIWQKQTRTFSLLPEEAAEDDCPREIARESLRRSFLRAGVRARLPLPFVLSPGTLSRISATENIHEKIKKKIYALRITWRNSGPKIANLGASRHEQTKNSKEDQQTCVKMYGMQKAVTKRCTRELLKLKFQN